MNVVLPRGKVVREGVNPYKTDLGNALKKLHEGGFGGYLHFRGEVGPGYFLYVKGGLLEALWLEGGAAYRGLEAIQRIFSAAAAEQLSLDIYSLSPPLAEGLCALFHGDQGRPSVPVAEIDPETYTKALREEKLSGYLRIYTPSACTLVLYRKGAPKGFFLDGGTELVTKLDPADSVASREGARIDFVWTPDLDDSESGDLTEALDLDRLWKRVRTATRG